MIKPAPAQPLTNDDIEAIRSSYLPQPMTVLFVGESRPESGQFFFSGGNAMLSHMQKAVEEVTGESEDFLQSFKRRGWYLDDLVLYPINQVSRKERSTAWKKAQGDLAIRISEYQPLAIVSLLLCIKHVVVAAAEAAGWQGKMYAVPFPGNGHQTRFRNEMSRILPDLLKLSAGP